MAKLSIAIVLPACVVVIGCFLPLMGDRSMTLWDLHGELEAYWIYGGALAALVGGVASALSPPMKRWHAMAALYGFLVIGLKFRLGFFDLFGSGGTGGRLLAAGTLVGAIAGAVALYKTSREPVGAA